MASPIFEQPTPQNNSWSPDEIDELLGLKEEAAADESKDLEEDEPDELETGEEERTQKKSSSTKKRWSKNPWAKLALIASVVGVATFSLGWVFSQFASFDYKQAMKKSSESVPKAAIAAESDEPISLEEENARLKAELAFSEQEKMRAAREKADNQPEVVPKAVKVPPKPVIVAPAKPTRTVPPRPQLVSSPVVRMPSVSPRRQPPPPRFVPVASSPTPVKDPFERWQQLSQLGSYRGAKSSRTSSVSQPPIGQLASSFPEGIAAPHSLAPVPPHLTTYVKAGQTVKAKLVSPLVWVAPLSSRLPGQFLVRLSEPLVNSRSQVVLPMGTDLLVTLESIDESGLVVAEITGAIEEGTQLSLPSGALGLQGSGGEPLIASQRSWEDRAGQDAMAFVFGALAKAGEISNRATSIQRGYGAAGDYQSQSYGKANYLGAVLEGGFNPLVERLAERAGAERIESRPQLWWLEAGTEVEISVNRSFQL
jgi:hypothetical protein